VKLASLTAHRLDRPLLQATQGRFSLGGFLTGLPVAILTTRGAKSGQARSLPLVVIPDGDKVILVASNWGGKNYPAWYHNLRAHPNATVMYRGESRTYIAREAREEEYKKYWRRAVELYSGYATYRTRTGGRPIPVMVLDPPV
jgi:deazaflavin-dependent oxidoreductase (nitroreductase family)